MPAFYHNEEEYVGELEWEARSVANLNDSLPLQVRETKPVVHENEVDSCRGLVRAP